MLVSETDGDATYNIFGQGLIASETAGGTYFSLADGLGSVRVEVVDGTVTKTATYGPYGKLVAELGWSGTTYGYAGEQYDQMTQLVYLRARYYNPALKVFISRDPFAGTLTSPATQHGYSYAHNNPVNYTDPTGRCAAGCVGDIVVIGILILALVAYATYVSQQPVAFTPIDFSGVGDAWDRFCSTITNAPDGTTVVRPADGDALASNLWQGKVLPAPTSTPSPSPKPFPVPPPTFPNLEDETTTPEPVRKDISLGFNTVKGSPTLFYFTFQLNQQLNPSGIYVYRYSEWFENGLSSVTTAHNFSQAFNDATQRARHIHFNLAGITDGTYGFTDPNAFIERYGNFGSFKNHERFTGVELYRVKYQNLCYKTSFYENNIKSAHAWNKICG